MSFVCSSVGAVSAAELPAGSGAAVEPEQNQAEPGAPTGQDRGQPTAGRNGEGKRPQLGMASRPRRLIEINRNRILF